MWIVKRIDEADYGCEERMPGEALMLLVTLESDEGSFRQFEVAENWIDSQGIVEGDEWPEDWNEPDETTDQAKKMTDFMENYLDALSEMNESGEKRGKNE